MKRTIRLTESELHQLIKETINEVLGSVGSGIGRMMTGVYPIKDFKKGYVYNEIMKAANIIFNYSSEITDLLKELHNGISPNIKPMQIYEELKDVAETIYVIGPNDMHESVLDPLIGAAKAGYNSVFGDKRTVRGEENPKFSQAIHNGIISGQLRRAAKILHKYQKEINGWAHYKKIDVEDLIYHLMSLAEALDKGGKIMLRKDKGQFYRIANYNAKKPQSEPTERMPIDTFKNRGRGAYRDYSNTNSVTGY